MRIKNVVKVMNFHSLLRVDKSKKEAESYRNVGEEVTKIIKTMLLLTILTAKSPMAKYFPILRKQPKVILHLVLKVVI